MDELESLDELWRAIREKIEREPSDGLGFLTQADRERLFRNGKWRRLAGECDRLDFIPVVRLYMLDAACIWLLTEIDPERPDVAFGLCDLGMGAPETGEVSITELDCLCGKHGMGVVRDTSFNPDRALRHYAEQAHIHHRIIT